VTAYDPENALLRHKLAQELRAAVEKAGFVLDEGRTRKELVFSRRVTFKDGRELPGVDVVVYSTIEGAEVRALGKDAIRVAVVYRNGDINKSRGLSKDARVFRVGQIEEIVERTIERMRSAWATAKELPRCQHCGTPEFVSKAGNKVCAAFCWEKR
jgi:hypothetical protein